jgi:hypothetical protein
MKKISSIFFGTLHPFISAFAIASLCALGSIVLIVLASYMHKPKEKSAISHEVVNDICAKLSVVEEPICQNETDIYPSDFYPAILQKFDKETTTYIEVQSVLGNYQIKLGAPEKMSDGKTVFASRYDFDGDRKSDFSFFFYGTYENNYLKNIICTYGIGF